ncbi:MAG: hypothetical protein IKB64_08910 [Paludibacteraceae bacterium]|nr:hypothetical protein [Paludibacteraceae bacterium]MBR6640691.1 hypothetical protein [Clostridia bacterium]
MMKRIITLVLSLIIMTSATAQSVVLDPTRLATETSNWLESFKSLLESGAIAVDKLQSVQKVLDNIEDVKKQVEVVSDYIGKGKKMQEIISYSESSVRKMMSIQEQIVKDPYMSTSEKIMYIEDLMDRTIRINEMISATIEDFTSGSKESGNMNDAERDDMLDDIKLNINSEMIQMEQTHKSRKEIQEIQRYKQSMISTGINAMFQL